MRRECYELVLKFQTDPEELYYKGISRYNSLINDYITVKSSEIVIAFQRTASVQPEGYVYSENSPVRFQLYRAACFYLVVSGALPEVKEIILKSSKGSKELNQNVLIQNWSNCNIDITWPKEVASRCFYEDKRTIYVIMTYYLKAQLDQFSHDAFRAAWSALNAVYNQLKDSQYESEKIAALGEIIRTKKVPEAEKYAKTLDENFWKHIQWHNFVQWRKLPEVENSILNNCYPDNLIYRRLADYLCSVYRKEHPNKVEEIEETVQKRMRKKNPNANEKVRFLVTEYCYMLRNRSFHAAKPYPIFYMKMSDAENIEQQLTRLLLLTIKDILIQQIV